MHVLAMLLCLNTSLVAQDLRLSSEHKSKIFKAGTYIEVVTPASGIAPCEKCSYNVLSGQLVSYNNDTLTMLLQKKKEMLASDGKTLGHRVTYYTKEMTLSGMEIPKGDILAVRQSGKKKLKEHTTGETIATCLGLLGLGHLASIPFAGENGDLLAGIGAAEVLIAIVLGTSSSPNSYLTNIKCPDQRKSSDKIWMLE